MTNGWSTLQITLALYPLGVGAAAVNLFFASLIGSWLSFPVLTPLVSLMGGMVIGFPITFLFARHIRKLMDKA